MSSSGSVCAVVYGELPSSACGELAAAIAGQTRPPAAVIGDRALTSVYAGSTDLRRELRPEPGESRFTAAVREGVSAGNEWLWLLDGAAVPEPGALGSLLGAAAVLSPSAPLLLASKVLGEDGRLHPDSTPRHEVFEKERSVEAAARHLVHLRIAAHGSVLVRTDAPGRFGPPRPDLPSSLDMREWSARILRSWDDCGYLVPASVAVRRAAPAPVTWSDWAARVRVLGSGAWTPTERLWEGFLLARDAATAIRPGRGQGRDAVGAPGRHPSISPLRITGTVRGAKRLKRR
ncbi:MAG TPA: hypothetical protein VG365_05445 [Solirubrobacteraceae bacterium]|nr:hypothetical protein [Solirubrobacteraceae bacterium]